MERYGLLAVAWVGLAFASPAIAGEPVGQVVSLEGTATIARAGEALLLEPGAAVFLHDTIDTGSNSRVQVQLSDGSLVYVGERSAFTLSEYVFAPGSPYENNCLLTFIRGVFRVLTGKITRLNPERFLVKTARGEIGIRGCDLGFLLEGATDHVYVIDLHGVEGVVVRLADSDSALDVWEPMVAVRLSPTEGLSRRPLTQADVDALYGRVIPRPVFDGEEPASLFRRRMK